MSELHPLRQARQQFEELANNLDVCQNPDHRVQLLKRMKILIDEIDKLIHEEVLESNPPERGTDTA